jgi:hypothetical protein
MYATQMNIQKGAGQPHVLGAMRQFADAENLNEIADRAGLRSAQVLRNKLLAEQPHQLTIHELVKVTLASGNRCLVDGILLELQCAPSVGIKQLQDATNMSLTDRALEITANAGQLGSIALDAKTKRGVTNRMRHEAARRVALVMSSLAVFMSEIESRCQSIPVLSVASDVFQAGIPMSGLS